ncbi:suppressor protein SRP40 [Drosophila teissieri]|uniref:suppressor protein SRP40 n=1 Tax=Drosophila teissieri TaxID=7243 RepID=UPI001CBA0431|nr:suppressor protein SRP40 [Drosophila teissieri]
MDMDADLTTKAIAELMREIEGPMSSVSHKKQIERKVNPLGKPNKRFLGRTINTAIRHNDREMERTQANCRQKLQDLDDVYERRKSNYFYSRDAPRNRSANRSRSSSSRRSRSRHKKSKKKRSRRRSSSSRSSSSSRGRNSSHRRKKHKKKVKKHKKSQRRRRSSSECDRELPPSESLHIPTPSDVFLNHSKQMALAVAMAYGQLLNPNSQKKANESRARSSSPISDIVRELMSDEEVDKSAKPEALSISSSDEEQNVLTIKVSSNSESGGDSSSSDSDSDSENSAGSCITLESGNNSDIEIIAYHEEPKRASETEPASEPNNLSQSDNANQQVDECIALATVDLTED